MVPTNSTRPPRAPYEQIRIVAAKAADAAWRAVKKIETYEENPVIAIRQREVPLEYREPSEDMVKQATALLELTRKERNEINSRSDNNVTLTLEYSGADRPEPLPVLIQAIRIGDQAIVSMPFEVLVEIGLEIKEKSPFPHTFLIEQANGSHGYLPPPNQHQLGGYETWLSSARFQEEASDILTKNLLEMLGELKMVN